MVCKWYRTVKKRLLEVQRLFKAYILVKYIKRVGSLRKASVRLEREGRVPAWESNASSMSPFVRMLDIPLVKL